MVNLLALDQSSHITGWAFFQDGVLKDYGTFNCNASDIGSRLVQIRNEVSKLIMDYDINYVIFEDIQLQDDINSNVKTFKTLAEVFGVVYELVTELEIKNEAVLSVVWKAALKIRGTERPQQKANAIKYVKENYNATATSDESDAICIGTYYNKKHNLDGYSWD